MEVSPKQFYLETPLYTEININDDGILGKFIKRYYTSDFDGFNPNRNHETTFSINGTAIEDYTKSDFFIIELNCKRNSDKFKFYVSWNAQKRTLMKIGQWPSVADFHINEIKQYDKLLGKEKLREFTKAIGLAANGVGIGSFVYLRRIFEDLISEAHKDYIKKNSTEVEDFNKKRINEKIDVLKDFLPEFLVENKELYGILSKGIHELNEKDCLSHFDAVKVGIEMILDEKLEQLNKLKKVETARLKIKQAASAITTPESRV